MSSVPPSYRGHRYPVEVISHCVWLYFRFPLSYREVEELMLQRGVIVSYETIRRWCAKFGQAYANGLRRRRPRPGDKWHLDEVFIKVNGVQKYLWRAVDQDGNVLDILVQNRRDKAAARRFFRRLMKKTRSVPRVIVTDKLRFYGAAHREVMHSVEHRSHKTMKYSLSLSPAALRGDPAGLPHGEPHDYEPHPGNLPEHQPVLAVAMAAPLARESTVTAWPCRSLVLVTGRAARSP
ncbi:IS6 family transposase [Streptomyces mirabilis]|uniref:IS6 family transposase n=1 Tax=Streptomyces mirabilis TaxID=68239 RepID=UPI0036CA6CF2